jgi:hypothetical protein
MSRARSIDHIVDEHFNIKALKQPFEGQHREDVQRRMKKKIEALMRGDASSAEQQDTAKLLNKLYFRNRGRPKFVVKVSDSGQMADMIETMAADFMCADNSLNFAAAVREAFVAYQNGIYEVDGQKPSISSIETYYKKSKSCRKSKDINYSRKIDAEALRIDNSPDIVIERLADGDDIILFREMFRYRHGRNCRKRDERNAAGRETAVQNMVIK